MAEPYVLEVEDLIKTYPKFLLDKVSFALPLGRVMGFVGQNGAGKTVSGEPRGTYKKLVCCL